MKRVLLVRHGQSQHHVNRAAGADSELTGLGREEAVAIAERLRRDLSGRICRLIASDLRRAWETARVLGKALGVEPVAAPELREWRGKIVEQMTPAEKRRMEADRHWFLIDWPEGKDAESWRSFYGRVARFMDGQAASVPDDEPLIVVAHGGTVSNIVAWWLRIPVDSLPGRTPFAAEPASISILDRNEFGEPFIERLNDRTHLAAIT